MRRTLPDCGPYRLKDLQRTRLQGNFECALSVLAGLLHRLDLSAVIRGGLGGLVELPGGHVDAGERVRRESRTKSLASKLMLIDWCCDSDHTR